MSDDGIRERAAKAADDFVARIVTAQASSCVEATTIAEELFAAYGEGFARSEIARFAREAASHFEPFDDASPVVKRHLQAARAYMLQRADEYEEGGE